MKFVHLSDLHLGKRLNEFSMIEDQEYILLEISGIIENEKPDAVFIAGDIYDKPVPSGEAMALFDTFITKLSRDGIQTFIISGNHDSAERISYHSSLLSASGVHLSPVYSGTLLPYKFEDCYGQVDIYMLPFVKPATVRSFFPDEEIITYTDAVKAAISQMGVNDANRNVLIAHQFVTGAVTCDSEEKTIGGIDNVDVSVFDPFDYVALGHIHSPQYISRETVRYCGTPLKYSFSEIKNENSLTIVELKEKGNALIRCIPLIPKHNLREIVGTYNELAAKSFYDGTATDDYLRVILKDEQDVLNALGRLRVIYPNIMKLEYDNTRTRSAKSFLLANDIEAKSPFELFSEFYEKQNGCRMSAEQSEYIGNLITRIMTEEKP